MRGELLEDRYRLEERLGEGGMGEVWGARDVRMHRRVAAKLVRVRSGLDAQEVEQRFLHEVRAAGNLPHRHTVTVHDCGESVLCGHRVLYLVMERLTGRTLAQLFHPRALPPWYDLAHWAGQICDALAAAHERGIVHRDIKPGNVMLTDAGVIKVLDFGLAKILGDSLRAAELTVTGQAMGTPWYMSPEQARGERRIDHRTDLYALGCLLYHGLTGEPPFTGASGHVVLYQHIYERPAPLPTGAAPPAVEALVARLMAKDPADRPQSAGEVARELDQVLRARGHQAPAEPAPDREAAARTLAAAEAEARELVERARQEAAEVRRTAEQDVARLRETAEQDVARLRETAEQDVARLRETAERDLALLHAEARRRTDAARREAEEILTGTRDRAQEIFEEARASAHRLLEQTRADAERFAERLRSREAAPPDRLPSTPAPRGGHRP
ncbi:serine/threonine-protein kinase [Streptomyces sp. WAC06614]|uniref:serine/threonine-protein kinase n=1 Tax=Streptomyces sp. WAC06614 TaxID=2487416 RepID=UPI000F793403|nr:serine/threonine-protein kinase [Streptomyces sp. WAC06614]RSS79955.1 serine/threonine protein kinase [Streptomyces sp. WAC06614]